MKRIAALLVVAGLFVWGLALVSPDRRSDAAAPDPLPEEPEVELPPAPRQAPPAAPSEAPATAVAPSPAAPPELQDGLQTEPPRTMRPEQAARYIQMQSQVAQMRARKAAVRAGEAVEEATGEQGDGLLSPRFRELEHDYMEEPRNGDWAHGQEREVRDLLRGAGLAERVVLVHCREETCRLMMRNTSPQDVDVILRTPGLRETAGITPDVPYSLRGGDLVVYFRPEPAAVQ